MKRIIHISKEFEAVFLIDGQFCEEIDVFEADEREVLFITVLPLKASLLPYTLKLVGGIPQNNRDLAVCYFLPRAVLEITLKPRFNYVYSPQGVALRNYEGEKSKNSGVRYFFQVKNRQLKEARTLITPALSEALSDEAMADFFSDFEDALHNSYFPEYQNSMILVDRTQKGSIFQIAYKNGLIDNISRVELN